MQIIGMTATEVAQAVARKDVSVAEVAEAQLARIAALEPDLGAVVETVDAALDEARAMDAVGPQDLPLWGVPVTVKINTDLKGFATTNGLPAQKDLIAHEDAAVVANLRRAGAVVVGRSNAPEFSLRWFTSNPLHGETKNPWDASLTPGGSSGGAAAAVATGMGALGHGNDLGGSLRYPAYCCGLATLRPSFGRVPTINPTSTAERGAALFAMSVQGVIARSLADVALALPSLSKGDFRDPNWRQAPPLGAPARRVGYCVDPFGDGVASGVERAVLAAVEGARGAGYDVVEVEAPRAAEAAQTWGELLAAETELTLWPTIQKMGSAEAQASVKGIFDYFGMPDRDTLIEAWMRRTSIQRDWAGLFQFVDALILPVSAAEPFGADQDFRQPDTVPEIVAAQRALCIINVLGLPSVALRTVEAAPDPVTAQIVGAVPLGAQIVGPIMGDDQVLEVGQRIERHLALDLSAIDPR